MLRSKAEIDGGRPFDWGRAAADYARYRDIYPGEFYERVAALGLCQTGQHVLDLGTGTGVLPRHMRRFGASFVGADVSAGQIAQAQRLTAEASLSGIEYVVGAAEELDFPAAVFDVVTACQCFQYFDTAVLPAKIHTWLKPGGRLCILFMAWLPGEDAIAAASEALVLRHNPGWNGANWQRSVPEEPPWAPPLFKTKNTLAYDLAVPFTRESWHGRIRACRGVGASSLPEEALAAFEAEHTALMARMPEEFSILHHVTVLDLERVG